jgi:DNA-binding protein
MVTLFANTQEVVDSRARGIVFRSVNVIPMDKEQFIPNQSIASISLKKS